MARRYDRGEFRTPTKTPEGFLRADAYVTRAGVFVYRDGGGRERRELRHPDEVFDPESLATLAMVPLTLEHPPATVTAENARELTVGHVGDSVARDAAFVKTPVLVTDAAAVAKVLSGTHQETSCGYVCDIDETPGEYEGEAYDVAQRRIRYNHVALVPKGRAGPDVRVRLDADSMAQVHQDSKQVAPGGSVKTKVIRNDVSIELEDAEVAKLNAMLDAEGKRSSEELSATQKKLADAMAAFSEKEKETEKAKSETDAAKAKADHLEAELAKAKDVTKFDAAVSARVGLVAKSAPVLGDVKLDGKSDRDVKVAVLEKLISGFKADGLSDAYIDGRFDAAVDAHAAGSQALGEARKGTGTGGEQKADATDPGAARKRMIDRYDGVETK